MYRECEKRIQNWIDNSKKALLIYGARQVGKTYIIREMLSRNHIRWFEINLVERQDILESLRHIDDAATIEEKLALYSDGLLVENESVIFIDEVQCYPEIITKIKFLVDKGKYRYILSGSNLGVELENIKSMPVGYVEQWKMYPMTYREFSLAIGISEKEWAHVEKSYINKTAVDELIHRKFIRTFYYYLVSGGMPAAINSFIQHHNLNQLKTEQLNIKNQYKADFTKYEAKDRRLRIISIYDSITAQLRKQDLRFKFVYLDKELKFDRYERSFLWLKDACVALPLYQAEEAKIPLEISRSTNKFRLFNSDVGLLVCDYSVETCQMLLNENVDAAVNNGALFENYVAQELTAAEIPAYYYKKTKIGEIDFLIERNGKVLPMEVKSGKDHKEHKALNNLMAIKEYGIERAVVLSTNNIEEEDNILYLPIYMVCLLKDDKIDGDFVINL